MIQRMILAVMTVLLTLPAAISVNAQDDDIYFSRKKERKAAQAVAPEDDWSTHANDDWNLDDYNRRSTAKADTLGSQVARLALDSISPLSAYDLGREKDTVYVVEQYYYSDLIRRFHNPFFSFHHYMPWYDYAYYDPFYWDYSYYDPWWYCTPSYGYYNSWYWYHDMWDYGYYGGWYGGWYNPYYNPHPHYYAPHHPHHGGGGSIAHGKRNNVGGYFGNSNLTGRDFRTHHGGRQGNGSLASGNRHGGSNTRGGATAQGGQHRSNFGSQSTQQSAGRRTGGGSNGHRAISDNSNLRRSDNGMRQSSTGRTTPRHSGSYTPTQPSTSSSSGTRSQSRSSSSSSSSYTPRSSSSSSSNYTPRSSSSSSHSSSSSYSGGGSSYSGGGGGGSRGGGSYGGGGGGHRR